MITNLVVHTEYSLLESCLRIQEYVTAAAESGFSALAITDTNNTYGVVKFYDLCLKQGIKPILGATLSHPPHPDIVLLAKNMEGYAEICSLLTLRNSNPASFDPLTEIQKKISSCYILVQDISTAKDFKTRFPSSLFMCIDLTSQDAQLRVLESSNQGIPFIPVWPSRFLKNEDFETLKILFSIKRNRFVWEMEEEMSRYRNAHLPSLREFRSLLRPWPEAERSIHHIVESCSSIFPKETVELPERKKEKGFSKRRTSFSHLASLCWRALNRKFSFPTREYTERLSKELRIIRQLGLEDYFLIVQGITRFASSRNIFYTGRGSAANALTCFLLDITFVDPVRHRLLFERFLHPKRKGLPDIDIDFPWDRREEVIRHVYDTYGTEYTALIGTHVRFNPRSAIRETARVFGLSQAAISHVTKRIPWYMKLSSFPSLFEERPEFKGMVFSDTEILSWKRILTRAEKIAGLTRHISIHPGGMVMTAGPLSRFTALDAAPAGFMVTQLDMYDIERLGLLKMDLLGQRALAVIASVFRSERMEMEEADFQACQKDPRTVACISEGRSIGCFYIESPAMRQLLRKLQVKSFDELTAASSVIRPGVAESGMMQKYIEYSRNSAKVTYLCPQLRDLLSETYGIMIYQEDVIRVSMEIAGLLPEEADVLRKAMSGKGRSHSAIKRLGTKFVDGCIRNGLETDVAEKLWDQTESFAGYAFCKAHSASFARLSYITAFLKTRFPGPFMAAVISNRGGFYPSYVYVEEARNCGLRILPPDVNMADAQFQGGKDFLRAGFTFIKGLREKTIVRILQERNEGLFRNIPDFISRCSITRSEMLLLAASGALDGFGLNRRQIPYAATRESSFLPEKSGSVPQLPDLPLREKVIAETSLMGMGISASPAILLEREKGQIDSRQLLSHAGKRVRIPGVRVFSKPVLGKKKDLMEFVSFMDEYGTFEIFVGPKEYARLSPVFHRSHFLHVTGTVKEEYGTCTITCEDVRAQKM